MKISLRRSAQILMVAQGNIKCSQPGQGTGMTGCPPMRFRGLVHWRQARILVEHEKAILFHELAINSGVVCFGTDRSLPFRAGYGSHRRPGGAR
jgi:hypothetical protein